MNGNELTDAALAILNRKQNAATSQRESTPPVYLSITRADLVILLNLTRNALSEATTEEGNLYTDAHEHPEAYNSPEELAYYLITAERRKEQLNALHETLSVIAYSKP